MLISSLPKHHAVLITTSNRSTESADLWTQLNKESLSHRYFNQTVLDIDTARTIISWAKTPYNEERIALISFHTAGIPAQNALLKILEEPPHKTRFIIITSNKENLLTTVISRVEHHTVSNTQTDTAAALIFLKTSPPERIKISYIVNLLEKKDEGDRKDRESVRAFILSLLPFFSKDKEGSRYATEILETASYASDLSASGKALLEYLSLLLPERKV